MSWIYGIFAQVDTPDVGLDGQEVANAVASELSQFIVSMIGLAIAFIGLRYVMRWALRHHSDTINNRY